MDNPQSAEQPPAPLVDPPTSSEYRLPWVEIRFRVPGEWMVWLREAARARSLPVSGLVRQLIRELMVARHDVPPPPSPPVVEP